MQVEQVRIADIIKSDKAEDGRNVITGVKEKKAEDETLRDIQLDCPFYEKGMLKENTVAQKLEKDLQQGAGAEERMNQIAVFANTTTPEDLQKMQQDGFDPMNTEVKELITVVDKIKLALAKGGVDISKMGGLSDSKIKAMTGSEAITVQIEQKLKEYDIPVEEELSKEIETAVQKAGELKNPFSEESVAYLMTNGMTATIDDVYQASFATGSETFAKKTEQDFLPQNEIQNEMKEAFEKVISEAGLDVTEETLRDCGWMLEHQIPVTEENLIDLEAWKRLDVEPSPEDLINRITDAVLEGKEAGEASLTESDGIMSRARKAYEKQQEELSQITAARQREEARMLMSVQANASLLKKGIAIDTLSIEETIEKLKELEESYVREMLKAKTPKLTEERADCYRDVTQQIAEIKEAPAVLLGKAVNIAAMTIPELKEYATPLKDAFVKAKQRYETLWTAPRRDMGDSMEKAFANVDDILRDMELETSEENRRAVRILAYNETEMTTENINRVKAADMQVQRLFGAMTPAAVTEMIKKGHNPLDLNISDLTKLAENLAEQSEFSEEENFAKFLWKAEHTGDITTEERESYIGVYRLIHQVEKADGAPIGALLAQGTEVTLRNLMTAVRSKKHTQREYTIDEDFGEREAFDKSSLSITEQIEMAYQTDCLKAAGKEMTPVKMKEFSDEAAYLDLSPEKFHEKLNAMQGEELAALEEAQEKAYAQEVRQEVVEALESEQQVYDLLERYDIPQTPAYLSGVREMLRHRNEVYRKLLRFAGEEQKEKGIEDVIQELLEDYGESVKTPEEMAKAQRRLEETAENVMKHMLVEKDVSSIQVRDMKLVMTQLQTIGKISKQSETYHIPIMVEDEVGNLSLKIVRGTEEKGLVDIALDTEKTGVVYASFRYEAGEISGDVSFEKKQVQTIFSENMTYLADAIQEKTDMPVSLKFAWDKGVKTDDFYKEASPDFEVTQETSPISTKALYGVAKSFIDALTDVI